MNTRVTRPLVESALLAALGAVMTLMSWYLPAFGIIIGLVSPLPVAVTVVRHGTRWGVLSSIVTLFIVAMFAGWLVALSMWVINGAVGISFGFAVRRHYRAPVVLGIACLGSLVATVAEYASAYFISGLTLTQQVDEMIATMQRSIQMVKDMLGPNPSLDQMAAFLTRDQFFRMAPSVIVLTAIMLGYVNFELFRRIMPRLGYSMEPLPPFSRWIFPEAAAHAGILAYLTASFQGSYNAPVIARAAENVFTVMSLLFVIEAMAVAAFFLLRGGMSGGLVGIFLFFGVSMIASDQLLGLLVTLFGMIDVLFDFRHIRFHPVDEL